MSQVTLRLLRFTYKKLKVKLTVSDSKTLFHEEFPYVIPSLYKRVVDELLVELNLLSHQKDFIQDSYFCVGLTETFKNLTEGYEPNKHLSQLFSSLCKSTNFEADEIKEISTKTIAKHKDKSLKEIVNLIKVNSSSKLHYSRITMIGLYKIISLAKDFKDESDISKIEVLAEITNQLEFSLSRAEKDISFFKTSIKKLEQAKALMRETISSEREKRNKK